eukprot:g19831.t1
MWRGAAPSLRVGRHSLAAPVRRAEQSRRAELSCALQQRLHSTRTGGQTPTGYQPQGYASSFRHRHQLPPDYHPNNRSQITFTCTAKGCNMRNTKTFSHAAYYQGVVIITCDGCKAKHLIADNLGIFGEEKNIEEILQSKGLRVIKVQAAQVTKIKAADQGKAAGGQATSTGLQDCSEPAPATGDGGDMSALEQQFAIAAHDGTVEITPK